MTWHRPARIAVAAIGLGCAAAVYWYTRERPAVNRPADSARKDPAAKSETGAGSYARRVGGKEQWVITYAASREYADGRMQLDQARFKDKIDGFEISADSVDTAAKLAGTDTPSALSGKGHVHVVTQEGGTLDTDAATYEDATGIVKMPGPLTFTRGRISGRGIGATYDRRTSVLNIFDQVHVDVAPDPAGGGAITTDSQTLLFTRNDHTARLDKNARIVREDQTLVGDTAVLFFTDDEQQLKSLQLRGHAAVTPAAAPEPSGPPEMHADDITLQLYPDGRAVSQARLDGHASMYLAAAEGTRSIVAPRIGFSLAPDGKTLTRLNAKDGVVVELPATKTSPNARKITSQSLDAQGNDTQGLTAARFDERAVFTETKPAARGQKPGDRTGRSRVLVLVLKGQLDAIDQAEFRESATFVDGDVTGSADIAVYKQATGDLQLRPAKGSANIPHVQNGATMTVDSDAIDVNTTTQDLDARGRVRSVMYQQSSASSGKSSSLFEKDKPVNGSSLELHYKKETGEARFVGSTADLAKLRQEQNTVDAVDITVWDKTQNLRAVGQVDSRFLLTDATKGASAGPPSTSRVTANSLDYLDTARTATYRTDKNDPEDRAKLISREGTTSARLIVLTLAAAGRSIEKVTADELVDAKLEGGRYATGDHMVYDALTEDYTLSGKPATAILPRSDGSGCDQHTGQKFIFNRKTSAVKSDGKTVSQQVSCPK